MIHLKSHPIYEAEKSNHSSWSMKEVNSTTLLTRKKNNKYAIF